MPDDFLLLGVFLLASGGLTVLLIYLEDLIAPKVKSTGMAPVIIESAEKPTIFSRVVGFQYYLYALIFVVIEALLVILFLWAQSAQQLGTTIFVGVSVSLIYMLVVLRYVLRKVDEVV